MTTWNGMFFHNGASNMMESVLFMHDYSMMFMFSVLLLVLYTFMIFFVSSFYSLVFFEEHTLENSWTLAPFILLFVLIIPSLSSLYVLDSCYFCGSPIKIVGHQWYWSYQYIFLFDYLSYDSYMSSDSFLRLLDVDNRLVVPCSLPLRFVCTSLDVIHSWTVPSFGLKMDAIPGRLNQFCTLINRPGVFFGQCSEICGANHSFMPIVLESLDLMSI